MNGKALASLPVSVVAADAWSAISSNTRTGNDKNLCISPATPPDIPGTLPARGAGLGAGRAQPAPLDLQALRVETGPLPGTGDASPPG